MKSKPKPAPERHTILLVDDDPSIRMMLNRVLRSEGYHVLSAANGIAAEAIAEANHIDLVLLDLNMPAQSGWDTFEKLTSHDPLMAVIIVTARHNQLFTALGAGVGALLEKPLDFPRLLETIHNLLTESTELRLARIAGQRSHCHYLPSTGKSAE